MVLMSANEMYFDACAALGVALATRTPVILWGAPGQGKTSVLNSIAEQQKSTLTTILASIREPSDFAGLPNVVGDRTKLIAPDWAQRISADEGHNILFFDEISTAVPATQAAMLRVTLDRIVGDTYLGDEVSIVAAANPPEQAADGWDLAPPMANRFVHLDWALPASIVQEGLALGWPEVHVPTLTLEDASQEIMTAKGLVGAFLGVRNDYVTVIPEAASESGRAFPTPRSWEMAATLYGYATAAGSSATTRRLLMNGTVGQAASSEFLTYIQELDLPDAESVLANPKKWEVPTRGDKVYAVASSVLAAVKNDNTVDRWKQVGKVISHIADSNHSDIAVSMGKRWMSIRPTPSTMPDAATLRSLGPVFREAGLIV